MSSLIFSYYILLIVSGAILLAAVYHTILFLQNRLRLIGYYTVYLWSTLAYCAFRCIWYYDIPEPFLTSPDEILQMISFAFYIRFVMVAMELNKKDNLFAYTFCSIAPYVIGVYIVAHSVFYHFAREGELSGTWWFVCYTVIRLILLFVGFVGMVIVFKKRRYTYFGFILGGVCSIILFGALATVTEMAYKESFKVSPLAILAIGYNVEVFFYSAAISYKMRQETLEKERATRMLLEQEALLHKAQMDQLVLSFNAKEEERTRIATELHDEIGSTLSSISILSDIITTEKNDTSVRSMQHEIKTNARSVMEKMDDIIWSLNPRNDSLEKMLLRIKQFATPLFEAKNIDYTYDFDQGIFDQPLLIEHRQQIYLIIKEAVNNLVKHSCSSTARVWGACEGGNLTFGVTDSGKGFDVNAISEGNGLFNMRGRADRLGAEIIYSSVPDLETTVTIKMKIR